MKSRFFQCTAALMLTLSLSACVRDNHTVKEPDSAAADRRITLEVLNPKVEISTQFEQMVKTYEKENPKVEMKIVTFGGGADYIAELKARFAANQGPDIFPNGGYEDAVEWRMHLEDLSDQPWVKLAYDNALEPMKMDGKIYGMPFNYEGYGFIYNKDLFRKAGIVTPPKTLTELTEALKKLHAAGITPFANGYSDRWIFVLLLNIAFAQQDDPDAFIKALNEGTQTIEENKAFKDLIRLLDLTVDYGNKDYLTTDYSTGVKMFASGKAAILMQGNWVQSQIDQMVPNMNIGFTPIPINDEAGNDVLPVGVSNNWAINTASSPEKKREAKKFLNWMVSSEQGKSYLKDQFRYISAFKPIRTNRSGPLVNDILHYMEKKKTLSWHWFKFPPGVREEFGYITQAYVAHRLDRDQMLRQLQMTWEKAEKKS